MERLIPIATVIIPLLLVGLFAFLSHSNYSHHKNLCKAHGGYAHTLEVGFGADQKGCVVDGKFKHLSNNGFELFEVEGE